MLIEPSDVFARATTRRRFLKSATAALTAGSALNFGLPQSAAAREQAPLSQRPAAEAHSLLVFSGTARQQGQDYGRKFAAPMREFLEHQIYGRFLSNKTTKEQLLRYAATCWKPIRQLSEPLAEHYEGMAEGSGLQLEEQILITLHEELWHRGVIPSMPHCTAMAVGPPVTKDGKTYVCQSWDWFRELYGKSQMILWRRKTDPSVISYSYPGLWMAAGLNSAGIALCWTSVRDKTNPGPAIGVPTYGLIAHLLAQTSLEAVVEEVRRAKQAGWFTFVMADGQGRLLNIEASPKKLVTQWANGSLVRVYYGTREMTHTPAGQPVKMHPQCARMTEMIHNAKGDIDLNTVEDFYGDHEAPICKHFNTLDVMVYDTTSQIAYIARGPGCMKEYQQLRFPSDAGQ